MEPKCHFFFFAKQKFVSFLKYIYIIHHIHIYIYVYKGFSATLQKEQQQKRDGGIGKH